MNMGGRNIAIKNLKEWIIWFIGKQKTTSTVEILKFIKECLKLINVSRSERTIYRRLEELRKEGFIEFADKKGTYRLTEEGERRWSLLDSLFEFSNRISKVRPVSTYTFFNRLVDEEGNVKYLDILIRTQEEDYIKFIDKELMKPKEADFYSKIGSWLLLCCEIYFRMESLTPLTGLFKDKEETFFELLKRIPFFY